MAKKLSTLPVGAKVKDLQSSYFGKPIIWQIADKNHVGYPSNAVTLITERIICLKPADAREPNNSEGNRQSYGNNNYKLANLNKWLNSSGGWYTPQHSQDALPTSANVWDNRNPYDTESGFLSGFSQELKDALMETTLKTVKPSVDGGSYENVTAKVFLASTTEVGLADENGIAEGSKLALFTNDSSITAYPTAEAVSRSNFTSSSLTSSQHWYWWLRTPYASNSYDVRYVNTSGALHYNHAYRGNMGVRPLCNLSSEILVSDNPDTDGVYRIEWNKPPTSPSSITVPEVIKSGKDAVISWGISTDPENASVGYELERRINSGSWSRIYKGINRTYTDSITKGWGTVTYRVKAYDNYVAESSYTTGPTRTVVNNAEPEINTSAGSNLGQKNGPFNIAYSITDEDAGQTLTVREYITNALKRSYTATSGQNYSFQVTKEEWQQILNGAQTLKIEVQDSEGGASEKTFAFSKNESEIELKLKTPLPADDRVTKALISIISEIPQGATMTVEVCNNAFDSNPTWEDATSPVSRNAKIFLTNANKTAEKWGFNLRIKVKRNSAVGECHIASIGGNYE